MKDQAQSLLMLGQYTAAWKFAEIALVRDNTFIEAVFAKAEALYNTCNFEHALSLFYKGKVAIIIINLMILPTGQEQIRNNSRHSLLILKGFSSEFQNVKRRL